MPFIEKLEHYLFSLHYAQRKRERRVADHDSLFRSLSTVGNGRRSRESPKHRYALSFIKSISYEIFSPSIFWNYGSKIVLLILWFCHSWFFGLGLSLLLRLSLTWNFVSLWFLILWFCHSWLLKEYLKEHFSDLLFVGWVSLSHEILYPFNYLKSLVKIFEILILWFCYYDYWRNTSRFVVCGLGLCYFESPKIWILKREISFFKANIMDWVFAVLVVLVGVLLF
jgi:hypothetical protein